MAAIKTGTIRRPYMAMVAGWLSTLFIYSAMAQSGNPPFPAIIPLPVKVHPATGAFSINKATVIVCQDSTLAKTATLLNLYVSAHTGRPLAVKTHAGHNIILVKIDTLQVTMPEGYSLLIDKQHIVLTAHDAAGVVYGIQTLRQLWKQQADKTLSVAGCSINDYPRFGYRGMALDVSRHLFPVSFIKKYIDLLAFYKFNTFHWHLTDDQGWRIEIKQYPRLQSVAAWRSQTLIGHKKELPHHFDGKRYGGYYSQQEIIDVIRFAATRNITIIPEIEMPGHALAALAAYPALGCTGGPYNTATFWGVFDDVYCAGNDSTFTFLEHVLDEVIQLFPSKYIHIGGDECPKTRWKACPKCQQRMKALSLKDEQALQSYFIQRIEHYVNDKGRNIIGWDEILEGGLAPNATVMSWRGQEGGLAAARQQHNAIMTPESHLYFDYYQSLYPDEPVAAGGYTPLAKVYAYEPVADSVDATLRSYIKGVEGQAWSEYFTDAVKAEYMIFPRALALAELAWTPASMRNYPNFLHRLRQQRRLLKQLRVRSASNYERMFKPRVTPHKAIGARVTLHTKPIERFNPGAGALVNGITGTHRYNDNQWLGFSGVNLEAVIDLGAGKTIHTIGMNFLNYHWQRMWAPVVLEVFVSTDSLHFTKVYRQEQFPVNGINTIRAQIEPVKARYVKVKGVNKGIIPMGEYGAGGNALLLIDEIKID